MKCYIKVAPLFVRHDKQVIANWRCKNMLHNTFWRSTTVKGGLQKCKICAQTTWIATCEMQSLSVCIIVTSTAQEINLLLQESQRTQLVRRQNKWMFGIKDTLSSLIPGTQLHLYCTLSTKNRTHGMIQNIFKKNSFSLPTASYLNDKTSLLELLYGFLHRTCNRRLDLRQTLWSDQ